MSLLDTCVLTGEVYKCLVHHHDDLDPGCKKELGRAVHMAFFIWAPGAILTKECDSDINDVCLKSRPNMDRIPGAVGSCLADVVSAALISSGIVLSHVAVNVLNTSAFVAGECKVCHHVETAYSGQACVPGI